MNQKTIPRLLRYAELGTLMTDTANPNLNPQLKAMATRVQDSAKAFQTAHAAVVAADAAAKKEVAEATLKLEAFGRTFDGLRGVIAGNAPHENIGLAASGYPTPVDLFEAAKLLAQVLTAHAQEPWAADLGQSFGADLESTRKEWTEALESQNQVQKLRAVRRAAAGELSLVLVEFRKVVKAVYGPTSREYHSIKADNYNDDVEDDGITQDTANPADPTNAPATPEAAQDVKAKTDKAA
jgi:hypothetical protein